FVMLSRLIYGVCKLIRSNSMPWRTHVDLDLQRWDCREVSHAHQVVGCVGEGEDPVHFAHSAMPHFAQQGDRLQPAETLFDALSFLLTESIAGMLCRAPVDCAPTAPCQVLRLMGRHSQMSTLGHEIPSVEALISAYGHLSFPESAPASPAPHRAPPSRWPRTLLGHAIPKTSPTHLARAQL